MLLLSSRRIGRVFGISFASLIAIVHGRGISYANEYSQSVILEYAESWSNTISSMIFSHQAKGLFISSTTVPEAGFLLINYNEGGREFCSGTVVSPTQILTAAHCFCGTGESRMAFTSSDCQPLLPNTTGVFFSPVMGAARIQSIKISDRYMGDYGASDFAKVTQVASDLAIAELDRPLPGYVELGAVSDSWDVVANASFGRLFIQPNGVDVGLDTTKDKNDEFDVGVGQIGVHDAVRLTSAACGSIGLSDTVCTQAGDLPISDPRFTTSGVCGGDSGGGLFGWKGNRMKLLGVTAFFESAHGVECPNVGSQSSYYINLQSHLDWLNKNIHAAENHKAGNILDCNDLVISKAPTEFVLDGEALATVALLDFKQRYLHVDGDVPLHLEANDGVSCVNFDREFGTAAFCTFTKPTGKLKVSQSTGNMQVTLCKHGEDGK